MAIPLYPFKFQPIYKERIWGGRNLARLFGRQLPDGRTIGESWELADLAEGTSIVANGPEAGKTLMELTAALGGRLLGTAKAMSDGRFPLLLKLLDAETILSLQVHPDARAAAEIGGGAAMKTECWYVIESRGGFLYKGAMPGVTADQFRRAVEADKAQDVVRRVDTLAGDFHYLPAGMVHALGAGVVLAEVQTPSDTTYRVTDWGRGREVHLERSMQCIRFCLADPGLHGPYNDGQTLLATDFFTVSYRRAEAAAAQTTPQGRCTALMVLDAAGGIEVRHDGKVEPVTPLAAGETVLLPAGLNGGAVVARGRAAYLEITLPENP
jgi:mannose-6-phosphate isomerase